MDDQLLVVGIDPGMTAAYAALNTNGELVKLKSGKNLNLSTIITELIQAGRVIAVGTDVKFSPKFVEKFCSHLGAKLIAPKEDMKVGFKERFTENFRKKDNHQRDALAAALFAYRELKPLLKKIDFMLKREGKEHLTYDMTLLAMKGMSISDALNHLKMKKEEIKPKKRIRDKIKKSTHLIDKVRLLSNENNSLQQEIFRLRKILEKKSHDVDSIVHEKMKKILEIKEKRIAESHEQISRLNKEITQLKLKVINLNSMLFSSKDKIVIKHLKSLGIDEVGRSITPQDKVILVDEVNNFSEKALTFMKGKVETIICKNKPSDALHRKPFHFILAKNISLDERDNFALVDKESLKKEKEKADVLSKILQEYQDERQVSL